MCYIFFNFSLCALVQGQSNFLALESPSWLQQLLGYVGLQFCIVLRGDEAEKEVEEVQIGVLTISRCGTVAMYSGIVLSPSHSENARE